MNTIIYKWTNGNDKDFQRFYLKTEEYYSNIVGGIENRKGFIPYNISESITEVLIAYMPIGAAQLTHIAAQTGLVAVEIHAIDLQTIFLCNKAEPLGIGVACLAVAVVGTEKHDGFHVLVESAGNAGEQHCGHGRHRYQGIVFQTQPHSRSREPEL